MSRLNELIQELCPDGVEYRRLGQICKLEKGKTAIQKAIPGEYPLVVTTSERKTNRTYQFNSPSVCIPLVSSRGHGVASLNQVYYQEGKFALGNILCGVTPIDDEYVNAKYLFYYLNHNKDTLLVPLMRGGANVSLTVDSLERVQVPIPPLRIQHKIVSMLELFEKYILELSAELSARRKQYEYYRNQLLQFDSGIQRIALGDLFEFRNGLSKGKEFFGKGTPFIRYTDVYNNRFLRKKDITALVECTSDEIDKLKVLRGDVLFTRTSETVEDVGWSSVMLDDIGDCVFNGFTIRATPTTDKLLPEYCAFCFSTDEFRDYVIRNCAFTTRASLTGKTIANYRLAVPPIIIQKRIAEVLFSFDKICSDLDIGLPAEIEARTKQYEFYRDQLLTFAESGKTILTTRHDTTRHDTTRHDTTRHDTTRHDTTRHDTV